VVSIFAGNKHASCLAPLSSSVRWHVGFTARIWALPLLSILIGTPAQAQQSDEQLTRARENLAMMLASQFGGGVEVALLESGLAPQDIAITIEKYFDEYAECYIDSLDTSTESRAIKMLNALADGSSEEQVRDVMSYEEAAGDSDTFLEQLRFDLRECGLRLHQEYGIPLR
jgi:hypothetical protein